MPHTIVGFFIQRFQEQRAKFLEGFNCAIVMTNSRKSNEASIMVDRISYSLMMINNNFFY